MRFDSAVPVKLKDAYFARTEPEAVRILGTFYWALLIVLFFVLAAGGIGFGVYEFLQPIQNKPAESVTIGVKRTFTRTALQKMLQSLDDRAREYDRRKAAPAPRDPS